MQRKKRFFNLTGGLALLAFLSLSLVAWDFKDNAFHFTGGVPHPTDTLPDREKKIKDINDAIAEVERAQVELNKHLQMDMEKMQKELAEGLKALDANKIRAQVEEGLRQVDMEKIQSQIKEAMEKIDLDQEMAKVDMEKMKAELKESLAKVDMEKIKKDIEKAKEIDFKKMEEDMARARKEIENIGPRVKEELKKAEKELEKTKADLKETKSFLDQLEKDGLIDGKKDYTIKHRDGELFINGSKQPAGVYSKYKSYLEKHKSFTIKKEAGDFNMNNGDGIRRL